MGKQKAATIEVLGKAIREHKEVIKRLKKAAAILVLAFVAIPALAQSTGTETLGEGTHSTTCATSQNYSCIAPVIDAKGQPDGTIQIFVGSKNLLRYDLEGGLLWSSTDYDGTNFTHDGTAGTLSYTLATMTKPCGGHGRWIYTCRYNWVSGGTLVE
jgi:hypothetical protein